MNPAVCIIDPHISVCERAPGAGRLARGAARGGAERSGDPGRPGPRPGVRAGGSAAARGALLLGRSRRLLQPSSQRRATPGVRSTFSRSCPLARGVLGAHAHTPRPRAPLEKMKKKKNSGIRAQGVAQAKARQRCAAWGVPSERRPQEGWADAGGARPTQWVRPSPSARSPRRPHGHPRRRPCGLGRDSGGPSSHVGSPGRG